MLIGSAKMRKEVFLWPGFRDNMRVLRWIVERSSGQGSAHEGRLGWDPL